MLFILILRDIVLIFGGDLFIDGVMFVIVKNECVCFVGCNGVGKFILLKMVVGIIEFDMGEWFV